MTHVGSSISRANAELVKDDRSHGDGIVICVGQTKGPKLEGESGVGDGQEKVNGRWHIMVKNSSHNNLSRWVPGKSE